MPTTRKLTADELQHLADQGQDVDSLKDQQFNIYSPDEMQQIQARQQQEQQGAIKGGVVPTLQSHAGSLLGGGLAGTAGFTAGLGTTAALLGAPETGGLSLLPLLGGALLGAGTSIVGSKAGDILQHKVVEPTLGMSPQDIAQEQQRAALARDIFPKTSMATDIIAGGLAGGGKPTLRAPIYAGKGMMDMLARPTGETLPVYKQAVQNVITGNALNTAINAGVQLSQTGTIDPTELGASALGGAFMSEPSALGRRMNPQWKPLEKAQPETPSVGDNIAPDGTSIADVQAFQKIAQRHVDEIQGQNQDFIQKRDTIAKMAEDQYEREVAQQQAQDQQAEQWRQANWLTKNPDGTPSIADALVEKEYVRRNKVDPRKIKLPEQRALAIQQNEQLGNVPVDQMRQQLFDQDAPQRDPVGWQQEVQRRQQQQDMAVKQMSDLQEAQRQQMIAQQQQQESAQRQQDFQRAQEEERVQQLQGAEQQRQEQVQPENPPPQIEKPLTPNQQRILNVKKIQEMMSGGGLSEPREGGSLFQEAEPSTRPKGMTEEQHQQLLKEAGKGGIEVGNVEGDLRTPSGQQARGISYDPQEVGRRLIGIARQNATSDTGYHELTHAMLRDLDRSSDPAHQQLAESIRSALGGEEPTAQRVGQRYQRTVEELADAGLPKKVANYVKDVWAATKIKGGIAGPEDMERGLVSEMRRRRGVEDPTIANQRVMRGVTQYQPYERRPYGYWISPEGEMTRVDQTYGHDDKAAEILSKQPGGRKFSKEVYKPSFNEGSPATDELLRRGYTRAVFGDLANKMTVESAKPLNRNAIAALERYGIEKDVNIDHHLSGDRTLREIYHVPQFENEGSHFQPVNPDEESRFRLTQSALDRIKSDIPTEDAKRLSGRLFKVYDTAQNLMGRWWNSAYDPARNMSPEAIKHVDDVLYKEVNDKQFYRNELKTPEERKLYDRWRKIYGESFQQRKDWGEPVYEGNKARVPGQDPFYHATTVEPKVANILRQNVDRPEIARLSKDFIDQQTSHGISPEQAQENLKEEINILRGNVHNSEGKSSNIQFNANRKAQGIPLPDSWRRQDPLKNLEVYFRRSSKDLAFYHHVETDPKTMASLGYTKDPWNNPIHEPEVENLSGNDSVRAVTDDLKGERLGQFERNAHAIESLATVGMLGAPTEVHKVFSSIFKTVGEYADNPIESARILTAGVKGMGEAWTNNFEKIKRTGYTVEDSNKASDFLNTHLTVGERLRGLAKMTRSIYTLNGLTEKFTKSYLHAAGEYLIPTKVAAAEGGDKQAIRLLKSMDPDYVVGTKYQGEDLQRMASAFANQIHGTKDARTLPPLMLHDNEVSAFFKLSSWNIAQTNNFMRNVWTPAKQGNFKPLIMSLCGSILGGYVIKYMREKVNAKESSAIPSFSDLMNAEDIHGNKLGLAGNKGLTIYSAMAAATYAGFAGILSNVAKYPFDVAYKNLPQGTTFPLDEVVTHLGQTFSNAVGAIANDPNRSIVDISTSALRDAFLDNVQLARMTFNHLADAGMAPAATQYKKELSDKMGQLRRWKMATDQPYEWQGQGQGNPYMNLGQKEFKREQNIGAAMQEVRPLIQNILERYGDNPEVMLEKLKGLKQNSYESMPSMEDTPIAFMRYVRFLRNSEGNDRANQMIQDYLQHKMINQMKSAMVP